MIASNRSQAYACSLLVITIAIAAAFLYNLDTIQNWIHSPGDKQTISNIEIETLLIPDGKPRIVVETLSDESIRKYHIRYQLTDITVKKIMEIDGVIFKDNWAGVSHYVEYRYSITIYKGLAFEWPEIESQIAFLLKQQFNTQEEDST